MVEQHKRKNRIPHVLKLSPPKMKGQIKCQLQKSYQVERGKK